MIVATCRIHLFIPAAASLKAKRSVVKGLKDRIRARFNVSVAEIEDHDLWQRAVLGVAVVSNDRAHADQVLAAVVRLVEGEPRAEMTDVRREFL
ncbi:MAG: DUF503 domain-containing protein [Candidatus Eisenbacteria bacterium]|nr:DUF503 domain-containing protein [Candidatus Eisenbacteria bacterium]